MPDQGIVSMIFHPWVWLLIPIIIRSTGHTKAAWIVWSVYMFVLVSGIIIGLLILCKAGWICCQ